MFGSRFNHTYYVEILTALYEILNKSRREGMMAIESDIEEPGSSPIFSKYPRLVQDTRMLAFTCDHLRIMASGNMAPHELEGLMDTGLGSLKEELEHNSHAVTRVADGLPGFGIVAAVLGIVVTMGLLGRGSGRNRQARGCCAGGDLPRHPGRLRFRPLATCLEHDAKEELNVFEAIKVTFVAAASGMPPTLAVEFGRSVILPAHRPTFSEMDQAFRGAK